MHIVRIEPDLGAWRDQARELILAQVMPQEVVWTDTSVPDDSLFSDTSSHIVQEGGFSVSKAFLDFFHY